MLLSDINDEVECLRLISLTCVKVLAEVEGISDMLEHVVSLQVHLQSCNTVWRLFTYLSSTKQMSGAVIQGFSHMLPLGA